MKLRSRQREKRCIGLPFKLSMDQMPINKVPDFPSYTRFVLLWTVVGFAAFLFCTVLFLSDHWIFGSIIVLVTAVSVLPARNEHREARATAATFFKLEPAEARRKLIHPDFRL